MAAASMIRAPAGQNPRLPGHTTTRGGGVVRCSLQGAVVGGRTEWQSSCAVLSSKVAAVGSSHSTINGHVAPAPANGGAVLDLVPVSSTNGGAVAKNLPQPLSIADLSPAPMHGSQLRVAYQGVPGAYSEKAAGKAYPGCDAIPCDQFEVAFQAVELWVADRAVLPVENSLGGSIHRNYDLLLRHRLHIVGEVQLPVHHCLLALPGVRRDRLTRVISHPQALAQCEHTLTAMGLNVVREAFDDTAGAAEYVATNGLRDTAAIASSRAAELYGMEVLADGIQHVTRISATTSCHSSPRCRPVWDSAKPCATARAEPEPSPFSMQDQDVAAAAPSEQPPTAHAYSGGSHARRFRRCIATRKIPITPDRRTTPPSQHPTPTSPGPEDSCTTLEALDTARFWISGPHSSCLDAVETPPATLMSRLRSNKLWA